MSHWITTVSFPRLQSLLVTTACLDDLSGILGLVDFQIALDAAGVCHINIQRQRGREILGGVIEQAGEERHLVGSDGHQGYPVQIANGGNGAQSADITHVPPDRHARRP